MDYLIEFVLPYPGSCQRRSGVGVFAPHYVARLSLTAGSGGRHLALAHG